MAAERFLRREGGAMMGPGAGDAAAMRREAEAEEEAEEEARPGPSGSDTTLGPMPAGGGDGAAGTASEGRRRGGEEEEVGKGCVPSPGSCSPSAAAAFRGRWEERGHDSLLR